MSLQKLAIQLGLSKSTISRALNGYSDVSDKTRKRVKETAKQMGYKPNPTAQRLASGKSKNIGIILPSNDNMFVSPAFSNVLVGAAESLAQHGYKLLVTTLSSFQNEEKVYQDFIKSGLVDGLFIVRLRENDSRIKLLETEKFPFVCHGHMSGFSKKLFVDVDNQQAFYEMTKRQIKRGHTQIAFLGGPKSLVLSQDRYAGYKKAMIESALKIDNDLIRYGELNEQDTIGLTKLILTQKVKPTSILCADDNMALGACAACDGLGLIVGKDIAITGYGNYPSARYSKPTITSMTYDTKQVGEEMAKLMINLLSNSHHSVKNWHKAEIVSALSDHCVLN